MVKLISSHDNWPAQKLYRQSTKTDQHSFIEAVSIFSVAISKQLNAVACLCGVHEPFPLSLEETMPATYLLVNARFPMCTSLTPSQYRTIDIDGRIEYAVVRSDQ